MYGRPVYNYGPTGPRRDKSSGLVGCGKCIANPYEITVRAVPGAKKFHFSMAHYSVHPLCTPVHPLCTPCAHPVHALCTPCARPVHTLCTPNTGLLSLASYVSFMFRIFCSCVKVDIFGKSRFLLFHSECMIFCSAVPLGTPPKVATVLQM